MNSPALLLLIVAFGFIYFVLIRPQKRRQVEQQRILNQVSVGDEIVTAGGIYGEVTAVDDDDVRVRIAPELEVRVARRAIAGVTTRHADDADELEQPEEPERPEPTPGT